MNDDLSRELVGLARQARRLLDLITLYLLLPIIAVVVGAIVLVLYGVGIRV